MNKTQDSMTIAQIIKGRKDRSAMKVAYISLFQRIIFLTVVAYLIFTQVFLIIRGTGNGMFPAIKDGDLIIAFRLQRGYEKNDIINYKIEGTWHTGRVFGRETDVVTIDDSGILIVNGTVQEGEILYPTYAKGSIEYPYRVPEDSVFVLGDYRTQTLDSRDFGPIPMDDVGGKVITILRRRGL